ncbi:hypothetical protein TWF569_003654 [Orbilia oligospora]|nr:hypothetical protein TWF569_003654 [Orbilia oligospora]KAF3120314.1 hypothetical protein TWF594_003920 [Orbilia oligospora]
MMFTPRQPTQTDRPTQTDIKFKKLLDASPMLKGIGQQQQQRPKKSTLTTGKNGRPTANVKVSGVGVKQGDKTKAEKGQRNRENPMRASSDGSQSWMGIANAKERAYRGRMLARPSGPRDYWILGSRRKIPVYNETVLSKPCLGITTSVFNITARFSHDNLD